MWELLNAQLGLTHDSMKQIITRYRHLFVGSVVLLLVGVVALSMATRRPCLQARTGAWHTYKAGHMTESEQRENLAAEPAESTEDVVVETKGSPQRRVPREEKLPVALLLTYQRNHFRSPPVLQ